MMTGMLKSKLPAYHQSHKTLIYNYQGICRFQWA